MPVKNKVARTEWPDIAASWRAGMSLAALGRLHKVSGPAIRHIVDKQSKKEDREVAAKTAAAVQLVPMAEAKYRELSNSLDTEPDKSEKPALLAATAGSVSGTVESIKAAATLVRSLDGPTDIHEWVDALIRSFCRAVANSGEPNIFRAKDKIDEARQLLNAMEELLVALAPKRVLDRRQ